MQSNPKASKSVTLVQNSVTLKITHYEKKHRLRIRFRIREIKGTLESYLLTRITLNGQRCKSDFSTGIKIETRNWDSRTQSVKGKNAKEINHQLDQIRMDLLSNFELLSCSGRPFGPDCLKKTYVEDIPRLITIQEVCCKWLDRKIRRFETDKLAISTIRKARERQKNLEWIFKETGWEWPLDRIRTGHLEELETWLRNRTDWHWNTVSKILNFFKEVIRFGMAEGMIPNRPIVFRVSFVATEHHALTADQVRAIAESKWKDPAIQAAVDCFLFQCYTGLAYADLKQFDAKIHLKVNSLTEVIQLRRSKSPKEGKSYLARVPLLPAAKRILEKYNYEMEILSNQNYNPYLHLVGENLGLDWTLTSHAARRTFCTVLFNFGVSIEMIGEWVGHSTAKTTLAHYVRGEADSMRNEVQVLGYGT
jgi:integrase/recombinase XerD